MFYLMPAIQPLASLLLAGLCTYTIALAGVAALHFQPYIAPLLVRCIIQGHHRVPCMHACSALLGADGAQADAPPLSLLGLCCCC